MNRPIPWHEFDAEVALARHLILNPPWRRPDGKENRAMRGEYRRWNTSDREPTLLMLAPLWQRVPADGWSGLPDSAVDRAVHHAALILHLLAVGEGGYGKPVDNLGAAAQAAGVGETRFARLVNTPPSVRLETLSRFFRRFGREGVPYRVAIPPPAEEDEDKVDRRSRRATLRDSRYDDLAALLAFLFTDDPKHSASRWAAGYYRLSPSESISQTA